MYKKETVNTRYFIHICHLELTNKFVTVFLTFTCLIYQYICRIFSYCDVLDCLVTPEKLCRRFKNLSLSEVSDLAQMTSIARRIVMKEFDASASQIAIQDGQHAGQTVEVSA